MVVDAGYCPVDTECEMGFGVVHDSARTLSMFSFTQAALSFRLAWGKRLLSASRVCRFVLREQYQHSQGSSRRASGTYTLMRS